MRLLLLILALSLISCIRNSKHIDVFLDGIWYSKEHNSFLLIEGDTSKYYGDEIPVFEYWNISTSIQSNIETISVRACRNDANTKHPIKLDVIHNGLNKLIVNSIDTCFSKAYFNSGSMVFERDIIEEYVSPLNDFDFVRIHNPDNLKTISVSKKKISELSSKGGRFNNDILDLEEQLMLFMKQEDHSKGFNQRRSQTPMFTMELIKNGSVIKTTYISKTQSQHRGLLNFVYSNLSK